MVDLRFRELNYRLVDRQFSELRDEFPWQRFNGGRVVDVGGGSGHVSIYLAKVGCVPYSSWSCTVFSRLSSDIVPY